MASNASNNTSTLSTARSDPTAPINLQRASDYSLDSNTDASTTKRIFSLTGLLLTANCAQLRPNIIGASMAVGSWDKEGIIDIVDR